MEAYSQLVPGATSAVSEQMICDKPQSDNAGSQYTTINLDNQLTSDYSRIANYTATRSGFYNRRKKKKNRRLIYLIAAFGASLLRFSRRSTMHGLNHLAQARTAQRRLFWLTISIAALFGFFFNMFFLIEKYIQVPVLTNVLHDSDNFIFPDVTFCNVNPLYFPPDGTPEFERMTSTIEEFKRFQKENNDFSGRLALGDYLFIQRNPYYVHPKWLTIVECSYMQRTCSSKHFDERIIWPYGACYTFNATKMSHNMTREISTRTRFNRFRPDLRIIVYKALEVPEVYRIDPHQNFQLPSGIVLMIHEPETYPHIGHSIIVDECAQIELKMTFVKHLAKLGKCRPEREYISYVNAATNESQRFLSSQSDCLDAEVQEALAKNCGCQMHTMPIMYQHHRLPFCFSGALELSHLEECFGRTSESVDRKHCFLDICEHFTIDRVIAYTKFPAIHERHTYSDWLRLLSILEEREKAQYSNKSDLAKLALNADFKATPNLTIAQAVQMKNSSLLNVDFVNRNFMMLRVVPASLFMDRVEETEEYPFSRLLSDIGGCVGLWIGASLITLFEFADLILDCMDLGNIAFPPIDRSHENRYSQPPNAHSHAQKQELDNVNKSVMDNSARGSLVVLSSSPSNLSNQSGFQPTKTGLYQQSGSNGSKFSNSNNQIQMNSIPSKMIPIFCLPKTGASNAPLPQTLPPPDSV